ncbi:uncharacterized protein LOC127876700 [Dreissena polymorpha]|uniref:Ig-like domain-containing protein n=1 Tax=Dreissena polymorpha TaxID=45954 RepID=A0A9D4KNU4_DREPO|nr:uncharacterized protein LOC127876700 [Dreissena polymorpha]KAH3843010.1 hypothetical protein DPMN_116516 [Dreissena polymorpha]
MIKPLLVTAIAMVLVCAHRPELQKEYFDNVEMSCNENDTMFNFTSSASIAKRYWLLPNGTLLYSNTNTSANVDIAPDNFTLTVYKISDTDFGYYYCLLVRSDNTVDTIAYGLNTDGPYYGDLLAIYSRKAMVGGIAAGILFAILAGFCAVWQLRYKTRVRRNRTVDDIDKAIDGFDLKAYDNVALELDDKRSGSNGVATSSVDEDKGTDPKIIYK